MARKLEVTIVGDASSLSRAFKQAGDSGNRFGSAVGKVGKIAGLAIGGGAIGGLALTLKAGVTEWDQNRRVAAQTGAVIKSTGGAANVTAKHVDELSAALLNKTGIDDEQIASGQDMLLTFTDIRNEVGKGNDIFDQAAKASLDLSVAMGTDMKQSALQLGKALNDPARGMTRLQRIGVAFTDAQKEQVKAMVASGDTMGAQKVILAELNKEFGGSAEAMGKTLPGRISVLKESFNNLAGDLVMKLMPTLDGLVTWTSTHMPEIEAVMTKVFDAIGYAITNGVAPALQFLIEKGKLVVAWTQANWPQISAKIQRVMTDIRVTVTTTIAAVQQAWATFGGTLIALTKINWERITAIIRSELTIIRGLVNIFGGIWHGDFSRVWDGIKQVFSGAMVAIIAVLKAQLLMVILAIRGVIAVARAAGEQLGGGLKDGIVHGVTGLANLLKTIVTGALNAVIGVWNGLRIPGFDLNIDMPGPVPDINFGWGGFDLPNIPFLDTGGLISKTGLAVVHQGESVVPKGGGMAGGGTTINNFHFPNYAGDPRQLIDMIEEGLLRKAQRNGRTLYGSAG